MKISKRTSRILVLSLLTYWGVLIVILPSLPGFWVYNHIALWIALPDPAARKGIKVKEVKKPSTVTFSNGKKVDVGLLPALGYNVCHFAILIPAMIWYVWFIRRHGPEWFRSGKWLRPGKSVVDDD